MTDIKEYRDTLETWKGGKANGYYEPFLNEIHILCGEDLEFRTSIHERIHAERRNKTSARFAYILQIREVTNFLFSVLIILAITGAVTNILPFFFVSGLFGFLLACLTFEELKADSLTEKSMREIKRNGRYRGETD